MYFGGRVETTVTAEKNASMANMADIWKKCNFFNQQLCDFSMERANLPDNFKPILVYNSRSKRNFFTATIIY